MELKMIKYGFFAGLSFLLAVAVLEWMARDRLAVGCAGEPDISEQVWQVLAEARRILKESADGV